MPSFPAALITPPVYLFGVTVKNEIGVTGAKELRTAKGAAATADYIPGPDAEFNSWQDNFVAYANAHLAALGLVAGGAFWARAPMCPDARPGS